MKQRPAMHRGCGKGAAALHMLLWMVAVWAGYASSTRADISMVSLFRNVSAAQFGDGNSLIDTGAFFTADLVGTVADEYSAVSMTHPGPGSPEVLTQLDSTTYGFQSEQFFTQTAMDTEFPTGTYSFDATHNSGTDSTSVSYSADNYPQSSPYLDGSDYSDLQGMNAGAAFEVNFSTFTTGGTADESYIFFSVFDETNSVLAFSEDFLPATTAAVTIPANTLAANRDYSFTLVYSNRDFVASPGADFDALLAFDLRTSGTFASAVPESAAAVYIVVVGAILARIAYGLRKRPICGPSTAR